MNAASKADKLGRKADDSDALDHAVQAGLVAYGIVHLLIAWLAVSLAFGSDQGSASGSGALSELAKGPAGQVSMYVVAAGFVALVVWQLIEALVGHRDEDGGKRVLKRLTSAGKAVIYGALGVSALKLALGSGTSNSKTDTMTAKLMSMPGGQLAVGGVGVVILVVAGAHIYQGWTEKFTKKLDVEGHTGGSGTAIVWFGKIGYISKGVAFLVVGGLFVWAAWTHDPKKSGGLDEALHKVLQQPFGSPILAVIAVGIACYGLFCFAWARHLDR